MGWEAWVAVPTSEASPGPTSAGHVGGAAPQLLHMWHCMGRGAALHPGRGTLHQGVERVHACAVCECTHGFVLVLVCPLLACWNMHALFPPLFVHWCWE
jgi:hypothetical protein